MNRNVSMNKSTLKIKLDKILQRIEKNTLSDKRYWKLDSSL